MQLYFLALNKPDSFSRMPQNKMSKSGNCTGGLTFFGLEVATMQGVPNPATEPTEKDK